MLSDIDDHLTLEVLAAQAHEYAALSVWYVEHGDARYAALAAWAADVRTAQAVLLEGVLTDPATSSAEQELLAAGAAVASALAERATATEPSMRGVVESAREAMLGAVPASVRAAVQARLAPLDHLDALEAPAPGAANQSVSERLDGRGGEELVGDLLLAATDCRAVARMMAMVGDDDEAERQSTSADLASYEAYLILASAASGDSTLAVTELRWHLAAMKAVESPTGVDGRPGAASGMRGAILATAVPAERSVLTQLLELGQNPASGG